MKPQIVLFYLLFTLQYSCDNSEYDLNQFQIDNYNIYNVGDTLIFKSTQSNNIIRFIITKKENKLTRDGGGCIICDKYRDATVYYRDLGVILETESGSLNDWDLINFTSSKSGNNIRIHFEYFLEYYTSKFDNINNKDTISYFDKKFIDYYTLVDTSNRYRNTDIVKIYWQKENGIVKYDLKNGNSYIRINLP